MSAIISIIIILTKILREPFMVTHMPWYSILLSNIGCFKLLCRLFHSMKNPDQLTISNFVNCFFDFDFRSEHPGMTMDIITYDTRKRLASITDSGYSYLEEDLSEIEDSHSPSRSSNDYSIKPQCRIMPILTNRSNLVTIATVITL
jgi:hypothetical protein